MVLEIIHWQSVIWYDRERSEDIKILYKSLNGDSKLGLADKNSLTHLHSGGEVLVILIYKRRNNRNLEQNYNLWFYLAYSNKVKSFIKIPYF